MFDRRTPTPKLAAAALEGMTAPGSATPAGPTTPSVWALITGQATGTNRYAWAQVNDGDTPGLGEGGVTFFRANLADDFAATGGSGESEMPAYEINGRTDVPTDGTVRVRLWPAGDGTYYVFRYVPVTPFVRPAVGIGGGTDDRIVRWDGTGVPQIQDSFAQLDDEGVLKLYRVTSPGATDAYVEIGAYLGGTVQSAAVSAVAKTTLGDPLTMSMGVDNSGLASLETPSNTVLWATGFVDLDFASIVDYEVRCPVFRSFDCKFGQGPQRSSEGVAEIVVSKDGAVSSLGGVLVVTGADPGLAYRYGLTSEGADWLGTGDGVTPLGPGAKAYGGIITATGSGDFGTVTDFLFTNANGVSGSVSSGTTTPTLALTLGDITPTSVAATNNVSAGGTLTAAGNITTSGGQFNGSGAGLTNLDAGQLTGQAPFGAIPPGMMAMMAAYGG